MSVEIKLKRLGNFSPLRYPGGKAALAGFIDELIKLSRLRGSVYVEPYAGGAGAALSLLLLERVEKIIINDYDRAVYSFWKAITEENEWFIEEVRGVPVTVEEWRRQKEIYGRVPKGWSRELGFAFFFLNRTNRSGIANGSPIGGMRQTGFWKIDARFNRKNLIDRIRLIGAYANRIEVCNEDGLLVIQDHLKPRGGFIYLDPPYYGAGKSLYYNHFTAESHAELAQQLNRHPRASWVLTYDDVPEIRQLYPKRKIVSFGLLYSAHVVRTGAEIMIPSDRIRAHC